MIILVRIPTSFWRVRIFLCSLKEFHWLILLKYQLKNELLTLQLTSRLNISEWLIRRLNLSNSESIKFCWEANGNSDTSRVKTHVSYCLFINHTISSAHSIEKLTSYTLYFSQFFAPRCLGMGKSENINEQWSP